MNFIKILQSKIGVEDDGIIGRETITAFMEKYAKNAHQTASFFATVHHETNNYTSSTESLYYSSAGRIKAVWPSRFTSISSAEPYVKNPEKLGDKVYGGRMGNGVNNGDGLKYRGRGAIQLTGKNNYKAFAEYIGDKNILDFPDKVSVQYFWETAFFFFDKNRIWDLQTIKEVRKAVNGGYIGLEEVNKLYKYYYDRAS